eukprot:PITA_36566
MIITGNADSLIKEIKQQMSQEFEMKDLGDLHYCLGLEVWKDSGQTFLTQGKYARNLLERFRMEQCKTTATPLQQNLKLSSDDGTKQVDATLYRQLVGSLIYLTTTRPDLAYSVIQILIGQVTWTIVDPSQVMHSASDPGSFHGAAKSKAL